MVMPVYNEREAIGPVLVKWSRALDELGIDYVIRPYNDGSKDDSLAVMRDCARTLTHVEVRDKPNGGHGHTILTGYRDAINDGFDWIFQIDSDDEMGPDGFAGLWNKRENHDFLIGIRDGRRQPLPRKIMSFVSRLCVRIFYGRGVWDVNTPYRLMRVSAFRDLIFRIPHRTFAPNVIISGLAAAYGLRSFETRVPQHDRTTGEVSIRKWKLAKAAMKSFTQTIAFALSADGLSMRSIVRMGCLFACIAGMVYASVGLCSSAESLPVAGLLLLAVLMRDRKRVGAMVDRVLSWMDRHALQLMIFLLAVALLQRLLFLVSCCWTGHPGLKHGDSPYFLAYAKEMAAGFFPDVKSWTSIGSYAFLFRIFGESRLAAVAFNAFCQLASAAFLFGFVRRAFGKAVGLVSIAVFLSYSPFARHVYLLGSEHLFFLLLAMTLYALARWTAAHRMGWAVTLPLLTWLCIWTRGEAVLLLLILPAWLCASMIVNTRRVRSLVALSIFIVLSAACAGGAIVINERYHGTKTFLCSYDGWWPRLIGSNLSNRGRIRRAWDSMTRSKRNVDKILILKRYLRDHPENPEKVTLRPNQCHPALVPYIRAEINRRWSNMSLGTKLAFFVSKHQSLWRHSGLWAPVLLLAVLFGLGRLFRQIQFAPAVDERIFLRIIPLSYVLGMVCILAVSEINPRYMFTMYLLLPMYAALPLASGRERGLDV